MSPLRRRPLILALLTALGAVIGLAGCSLLLGGNAPPPSHYTLNSATAAPNDSGAGNATNSISAGYTLDLRPVNAPDWLNSKRMLYRLDYANNAQLAAYTRSAWADTPAAMIGDNLDDALSSSGLFAAVLGDTSGQADLALQIELADFSQHFSSAQKSRGRIVAKATLLGTESGQVIAQKNFDTSAAASSANAAGGVNALTAADYRLNTAVQSWLANTLAACDKHCLSGS